jgi:hypothetical protein
MAKPKSVIAGSTRNPWMPQDQRPGQAPQVRHDRCVAAIFAAVLLAICLPAAAAAPGLGPVIEPATGGQCVADPAFMRRNHPELLKHQRDDTLRGGVRQERASLKECISCHASKATHSVTAAGTNFCQSCHTYAAVKIDCFECHANQPQAKR